VERKRTIPEFKNEREMAEFWDTHSVADYWDQLEPEEVELAPELAAKAAERQRTKRITLRLRVILVPPFGDFTTLFYHTRRFHPYP